VDSDTLLFFFFIFVYSFLFLCSKKNSKHGSRLE